MSIQAISVAFKVELPPAEKLILLTLADYADPNGCNIYPAISSVAKKSGFSERSTQRLIRKLEGLGWIIKTGKHPEFRTTIYRLNITPKNTKNEPSSTPSVGDTGDTHSDESWVTSKTVVGDTGGTLRVTPVTPNPKENRQLNRTPSGDDAVPAHLSSASENPTDGKGNRRKPKKPKQPDPFRGLGNEFIDKWYAAYRDLEGDTYNIRRGKDHKAAKDIIRNTGKTPEELMAVAVRAWFDLPPGHFLRQQAHSITGFCSRYNEIVDLLNNKPKTVGNVIALKKEAEELELSIENLQSDMQVPHEMTPANYDKLEKMQKRLEEIRRQLT